MTSTESLTEGLTDEQSAAVLHKDGPLLILAGAGTGKTRVVTRRIAALVASGVRADQILAITFTNKAAEEMRERTERLVGHAPFVSTFHSFGARFLRRHAELAGLSRHYTIFDDSDQLALVKEAAETAKVDTESWPARTLLSGISSAKNKLQSPLSLEEEAISPKARMVAAVYPVYQELLRSRNAVDFDDLLVRPVELLRQHQDLREMWSTWFRYVLIDEYQDTNRAQYQLAMCLAGSHRNLCVTGDPDQSIYAWRGADISNILDFERDFPNAKVVTLTQNFRSTQQILDAANRLISFNTRRKEKNLVGVAGAGQAVTTREFGSNDEESTWVARRISELRSSGQALAEIACLYRANFQSRGLEEALVHRGIPYRLIGAVAFYERKEIKDLLAYLRLLVNPNDDTAALRIINTPSRRIGAATIKKLNQARSGTNRSLIRQAERAAEAGLKGQALKAVTDWAALIREFENLAADNISDTAYVLSALLESLSFEDHLEGAHPDEPDRWENVQSLIEAAQNFDRDARIAMAAPRRSGNGTENRPGDKSGYKSGDESDDYGPLGDGRIEPGLSGFLEHVSLVATKDDRDDQNEKRDRVSLMTVHAAKGLEFHSVFVIGLEDGLFPNSRALEDPMGIEEERRLAYVAFTRAKRDLSVTWSRSRMRFGSFETLEPSPFLLESGLVDPSKLRGRSTGLSTWSFGAKKQARDDASQVPPGWDDPSNAESDDAAAQRTRFQLRPDRRAPAPKSESKADSKNAPSVIELTAQIQARERVAQVDFKAGDRVSHEHFGNGKVSSVIGLGAGTRLVVDFDRFGPKTLVLQYARLRRLT